MAGESPVWGSWHASVKHTPQKCSLLCVQCAPIITLPLLRRVRRAGLWGTFQTRAGQGGHGEACRCCLIAVPPSAGPATREPDFRVFLHSLVPTRSAMRSSFLMKLRKGQVLMALIGAFPQSPPLRFVHVCGVLPWSTKFIWCSRIYQAAVIGRASWCPRRPCGVGEKLGTILPFLPSPRLEELRSPHEGHLPISFTRDGGKSAEARS